MGSRLRGNDKRGKTASSFTLSCFLFIVIVGLDPTIQNFIFLKGLLPAQ